MKNIEHVEKFWNADPRFPGEKKYGPENPEISCDAGAEAVQDNTLKALDLEHISYSHMVGHKLVHLGRGNRVASSLFAGRRRVTDLVSAGQWDISPGLCDQRLPGRMVCRKNAGKLTVRNGSFRHVNIQGVTNHVPDPQACFGVIDRAPYDRGMSSIDGCYNKVLTHLARPCSLILKNFSAFAHRDMKQGQDSPFIRSRDDFVWFNHGRDKPIVKRHSRKSLRRRLKTPWVSGCEISGHLFPCRFLSLLRSEPLKAMGLATLALMVVANVEIA